MFLQLPIGNARSAAVDSSIVISKARVACGDIGISRFMIDEAALL